jgi:histidinol-phosphate aminotransferase
MTIEALVRPEIRNLKPYVTARQESATVRLNANELPCSAGNADGGAALNRYPTIRPVALQSALSRLYGVAPANLLVTRGSSEAIDLLVRAFCRAGRDSVIVTPPTFAMYRVYADIQGARTIAAPLSGERDFRLEVGAVLERCEPETKLVFVCSPNNPTGNVVPHTDILELARARSGQSVIVVDEAYAEFNDEDSLGTFIPEFDNLVVLRTLSKALGLAGARCGTITAAPALIGWLDRMLAPYALATPVCDRVLDAMSAENLNRARRAVAEVVRERERMATALAGLPPVARVWPSRTNFLLVRFHDLAAVMRVLGERRILIRDFPQDPVLENCARITIGAREENDLLLATLKKGVRAGMFAVGAAWGVRGREELASNGANAIIDRPGQLLDVLQGRC